ncbi:MAG: SCP2 sterol-binding domain-containing protein [Clostridiales bacterium]|nr:SCP2 sterol-binding domain-containing protein [Clostridiales bacterium]
MTRQEIINELREKTAGFDAASYNGFLALQVTLRDLGEPLYIEIKDGKLSIEPYEYHDRQANLILSSDNFVKLINKKLNATLAFTTGKLRIEGNIGKATELAGLFAKE